MTVNGTVVSNIMPAGMAYIATAMRCPAVTMATSRPDRNTAAMIATLVANLTTPTLTIRPNNCGAAMATIPHGRVKTTGLACYRDTDAGNGQNSQYNFAVVTDCIHGLASEFDSICAAIKKHTKTTLNRG